MPLVVIIFLSLYALASIYLYRRVAAALPPSRALRWAVGFIIIFLFSGYLLAHLGKEYLSPGACNTLQKMGSWWIGFVFYAALLLLLFDLLRLIVRIFHLPPAGFWRLSKKARRAVLPVTGAAVIILLLAGHLNARTLRITAIQVPLGPSCGPVKEVNAVFLADIHAGVMVGGDFLSGIVDEVNNLQPDLILLGGDVVDTDVREVERLGCGEILSRLRAPLGVYAVTGNHEYLSGVEESTGYLSGLGIVFLRDRAVRIGDSFYLAGRDDPSHRRKTGPGRSLREILSGVDPRCPVILMDHRPARIKEAAAAGVDLLLCGHTHHGQLFPISLVIDALYPASRGYAREGKTRIYVTSGAGTWGPPVRIGNRPEIVHLKITFGDQYTDSTD
ncbi:MAG: metallophosphoesterase [PVC group bacterium]